MLSFTYSSVFVTGKCIGYYRHFETPMFTTADQFERFYSNVSLCSISSAVSSVPVPPTWLEIKLVNNLLV